MAKPNPIQIQKSLKGANYPLAKNEILNLARNNDASQDILETLQKIPDRTYNKPTDITEEIGKLE